MSFIVKRPDPEGPGQPDLRSLPRVRRLYILGAGASCPYGLPAMSSLAWDIYDSLAARDQQIMKTAILETCGHEMRSREDSPNIEDFLNRLDSRSTRYLALGGGSSASSARSDAARVTLLGLRKVLLDGCTRAKAQVGPYDALVQSLGTDEAIVSFNWDVLLEIAIRRRGAMFSYLPSEGRKGMTLVLKPHGSINWYGFLEHELIMLDLNKNFDVLGEGVSDTYMVYCTDPLEAPDMGESSYFAKRFLSPLPAIVPPDSLKLLDIGGPPRSNEVRCVHDLLMGRIWRYFEELIHVAEEVVVIGYSLPPGDAASMDVLKSYLPPGTEGQHEKVLHIVDPRPEAVERYRKTVHPGAESAAHSFEEYVGRLAR